MSEKEKVREVFTRQLNHYLEYRGISQQYLCEHLDVSKSAVSSWCSGEKMPRMDKVEAIAALLGVSISDLVEPTATPTTAAGIELSEVEFALFGEVRELDDEDKAELLRDAQRLREIKELRKLKQE